MSPKASKITKATYLELCEMQGIEPDEREIPLELSDLPECVSIALELFNSLRDTYIPGEIPQYNGKDLTGLPVLFSVYEINDPSYQRILLKILNTLDGTAVTMARKRIEAARKKK